MATARKKQDEKNLKTLRELVSLAGNKHCFDCNQRGPTYVNMTIGSFVCTKCSGMLRGLTPPQRVKSISMASFTSEEVDLVKSKGNEYCRQTWLGLYEPNHSSESKDEQQIKDFMIDKYEKKRYYLDPSRTLKNGGAAPPPAPKATTVEFARTVPAPPPNNKTQHIPIKHFKPLINGAGNANNTNGPRSDFVADFNAAFTPSQFNNNAAPVPTTQSQPSFANFDNNPIFDATTNENSFDSYLNQLMDLPKYTFTTNNWNCTPNNTSANNVNNSPFLPGKQTAAPPSEDRYAALKDLDNALKSQQQETQLDWSTSSNGSGYVSPAQSTGSLYGSPSTTGSMYGSPSQAQFASAFPQEMSSNASNPFSTQSPWSTNGNTTVHYNGFNANPFRADAFNGTAKFNGTSNGYNCNQSPAQQFQQSLFSSQSAFVNNKAWNMPNPFTPQGITPVTGGFSNNPFL